MSPGLLDMIRLGSATTSGTCMYLARYSNQPDLGAYLPRLQVPNSLLHSFNDSNIFFNKHKQPNPKLKSNQQLHEEQEQEQQQIMSLVGGLCFCTACNNLLERVSPTHLKIQCEVCGTTNPSTQVPPFLPPFIRHLYKSFFPSITPTSPHPR